MPVKFFKTLPRPSVNPWLFNIIVALLITVVQNVVYFRKILQLVDVSTSHNLLFVASMPVTLLVGLNLIFSLILLPYIRKPIVIFLFTIDAFAQYFMQAYGVLIDRDMIQNALDTTTAETLALVTPQLGWYLIISALLPSLLILWIKVKPANLTWQNAGYHVLNILVSLLMIVLIATFFYKDYASLMRNNQQLIKNLVPINMFTGSYSYYKHNYKTKRVFTPLGLDAHENTSAHDDGKKNLIILVVGETTRAQNFALGGYNKPTTPRLAADNVIYFPQTTSCGTATAVSVPCMFSNMPRSHYDGDIAVSEDNVLDLLQRANVDVLWRENDGGCKGVCSRVPTEELSEWHLPALCSSGVCLDEALLRNLDSYIDARTHDTVIVLHTMGSHGPTYYQRYPKSLATFSPTCDSNEIQNCSNQSLVNTYDNTIVYIDYMLDKTIKMLQAHSDKFNTALVYLSDHGESLGENGLYLHGMPYPVAPVQQTHIPMVMWLSPDYIKAHGVSEDCIKARAGRLPYSQDNLFSTLLGLFNVDTKLYQPELDIVHPCRNPQQ
ncbi:phosphoethanolamine transferase EptA [Acerihabitans sp. TG2]|uniref:phosphoethanolamine transferase EptA n=1 Tax=Acerihabitans sp. TG2 TaxID=3096008 RepID=UPI002B228610|nr:phosphoethanolamine transferase EptA [Acerihabitans sp. TG2]MEA9389232.1 phosphoethanolamine transferase EptA [Acerihabitans sp. TG2]